MVEKNTNCLAKLVIGRNDHGDDMHETILQEVVRQDRGKMIGILAAAMKDAYVADGRGGAPITSKDSYGKNPLHLAVQLGMGHLVKTLVGAGIQANQQDNVRSQISSNAMPRRGGPPGVTQKTQSDLTPAAVSLHLPFPPPQTSCAAIHHATPEQKTVVMVRPLLYGHIDTRSLATGREAHK